MASFLCTACHDDAPLEEWAVRIEPAVLDALQLDSADVQCAAPYKWTLRDGRYVYSSVPYGKEIFGYCNTTPLYFLVKHDRIERIVPGANCEERDYFNKLYERRLFDRWQGLTWKKASLQQVDAVSGATLSSKAVIRTVKATSKAVARKKAGLLDRLFQ